MASTKMVSGKDAQIISRLRSNARTKITSLSRDIKMPVTTLYDRLRAHEKSFVKRHAMLLDFQKLGFLSHAHISIKVSRDSREAMQRFLMEKPNINSLYRTDIGTDFIAEGVFADASELRAFTEELQDRFRTEGVTVFNLIQELKKEEFLSKPEHFEGMG